MKVDCAPKILFCVVCLLYMLALVDCTSTENELPAVLVAILARNKAHVLPYFFGYLEQQQYPKSRISVWIHTDHNVDKTAEIIEVWRSISLKTYHQINVTSEGGGYYFDENGKQHWTAERYKHVIRLREEALNLARSMSADYLLFLDCDALLVNPVTLTELIKENKTIVAPMLDSRSAYSNFWCGMNEKGYYIRTDDYMPILEREQNGIFPVPMVHSAVLINMNHASSKELTYVPDKMPDYTGPEDDIIAFAHSAKYAGIEMFVTNKELFGYILASTESPDDEIQELLNLKLEVTVNDQRLYASPHLESFLGLPQKDKMGFDQVYMINLERRPERRVRMEYCFDELGISFKATAAVDGRNLNESYLEEHGIRMLPEYRDPYHGRPITAGEIGCFMSHYNIWKDIIENQHRLAIVFEDDIRFEPYFRTKVENVMADARTFDWDLIYFGRKRLSKDGEPYVRGSHLLVHVDYSYWTLCYVITLDGARKLVDAAPLSKMVPVDEYLPIMFDKHPRLKQLHRCTEL
ncbi:procollagen galactosyltransferase 1-like isoform X2 [Ornithodoros turicata]|uniref:procollagen galactosyltransferase 1-like isoform X2 n=1 Tax=Ornithodoros turicata TaxID=34597 RepID=UPI003139E1DD